MLHVFRSACEPVLAWEQRGEEERAQEEGRRERESVKGKRTESGELVANQNNRKRNPNEKKKTQRHKVDDVIWRDR